MAKMNKNVSIIYNEMVKYKVLKTKRVHAFQIWINGGYTDWSSKQYARTRHKSYWDIEKKYDQ